MISKRLLLALCALAAFALWGATPAHSQTGFCPGGTCEVDPPTATVFPLDTVISGSTLTKSLTITITWCDDDALKPANRVITLRDSAVDTLFTYSTATVSGCRSAAADVGTVNLVPGANPMRFEITDMADKQVIVHRSYQYHYTPPDDFETPPSGTPAYSMQVAAVGDTLVHVGVNTKGSAAFTLRNTGNRTGTFALAHSCPVSLLDCTRSADTVTLGGGGAMTIAVHFTAGSSAGVPSAVVLSAAWVGQSGVQAADTVNIRTATVPALSLPGDLSSDRVGMDRGDCLMLPAGLDGVYECGDLRLAHALPATRVLNQTFAPTLLYLSQHARPVAIAGASVSMRPGASSIVAELTQLPPTGSGGGVSVTRSITPWSGRNTHRVAHRFDATSLSTGLYRFRFDVDAIVSSNSVELYTGTGWLPIVNRINSPFGNGWWLAGLEQVVTVGDGSLLWVGGDGSTQRYRPVPSQTNLFVGDSLAGPDTLAVHPSDSTAYYERKLPSGARVWFDNAGRHRRTETPLGIHTEFVWDGTGRLTSIRLPQGPSFDTNLSYTFTYNGSGKLSQVTAPGNRVVTVYNSAGRIDSIADPNQTIVEFRYAGATGRITDRYDRRGERTEWAYDSTSTKLTRATVHMADSADNIVAEFVAQEGQGLAQPDSVNGLYTVFRGPRPVADDFYARVNRWGAPIWTQDATARITRLYREDSRWPTLVTRVQHPNLRETTATYDGGGRITSSTDWGWQKNGLPATTLYEWDPKWSAATRVTSPTGEIRSVAFDTATGQRLWEQVGPDTLRRVRYVYHPASHATAPGQVERVIGPDGEDLVRYDSLGNVDGTRDVVGFWTHIVNDSIGRPRQIWTPIDSASSLTWAMVRDSGAYKELTYDAMGRVVREMTRGRARTVRGLTMPQEEVHVRTEYDPEGLTTKVVRWMVPSPNGIDSLVTEWQHDAARRAIAEIAYKQDTAWTVYDQAGNVVRSVNRLGEHVTFQYDLLNRMTKREVPGVWRGKAEQVTNGVTWNFPYFVDDGTGRLETVNNSGTGTVFLPGDTATFTYAITGGIATANNRNSLITREYHANGLLESEMQEVRTYAGTDFSQHVYMLSYDYDLSGRRISLSPPTIVGDEVQTYRYTPGTGELAGITDFHGSEYAWRYDGRGRLRRIERPGSTEAFLYDNYGRATYRREWYRPVVTDTLFFHDDRFRYDARGKVVHVRTRQDSVSNIYTSLGALARSETRDLQPNGTISTETYFPDPLAHTRAQRQQSGAGITGRYTSAVDSTVFQYDSLTGRLLSRSNFHDTQYWGEGYLYDRAGNRTYMTALRPMSTPYKLEQCGSLGGFWDLCASTTGAGAVVVEGHYQLYDPEGRLRIADRRTCLAFWDGMCDPERPPLGNDRAVFEEYRYDALGRRVLVRSRQEYMCAQRCQNVIRRTVWDGEQILAEISAPAPTNALSAVMEADTGLAPTVATSSYFQQTRWGTAILPGPQDTIPQSTSPSRAYFYGRVAHVHGPGIDAPLSMVRWEYSDSIPGPVQIFLHTSWKGAYDLGTFRTSTGAQAQPPCVTVTRNSSFQVMVFEPGASTEPNAFTPRNAVWKHCLEVEWPSPHEWVTRAEKGYRNLTGPPSWNGSLLNGMRDLTGQMYRRNRYYDPNTGQFTQEDPIGLAGGLNLYGFAYGDPVSYSDPYGLDPCSFFPWSNNKCTLRDFRDNVAALWRRYRNEPEQVQLGIDMAPEIFAALSSGIFSGPIGRSLKVNVPGPVNSAYGKVDYLLGNVPNSVSSAGKGGFFRGVLGFDEQTMEPALHRHIVDHRKEAVMSAGNISVTGAMVGANGRSANVTTVWRLSEDGTTLNFVSAVPAAR